MLQATFSKTGDPRLTSSRGDTIPRMALPGFLVDGMLFVVSFPNHNLHGGTLVSNRPIQQPPAPPTKPNVPPDPAPAVSGIPTSNYNSLANTAPNNPPTPYSPPPAHATPPVNHYAHSNGNSAATANGGNGGTPSSSSSSSPRGDPQEYKLSRSIKTVGELWQEWTKGLAGAPSVISLESTYGPKWRSTQAERKFYSRRKVIIEEVKKQIDQGRPEWDAIAIVDGWRDNRSLDRLSKTIVERRKSAVGGGGDDRGDYDGHDGRRESRGPGAGGQQRQLQQPEQQRQQAQQQHTNMAPWG
jgi:hypothetical protein